MRAVATGVSTVWMFGVDRWQLEANGSVLKECACVVLCRGCVEDTVSEECDTVCVKCGLVCWENTI